MSHIRMHLVAWASLGLVACKSPPKPLEPSEHALAGLAAQHVAVLPAYAVKLMPGLGPLDLKPVEFERMLDADLPAAFDDRGIKKGWLFPPDLRSSFRRNSSYAADPDNLAQEPLRSPMLAVDARLPEPLASQIRTLVALHDDVRLVLAPVELRLEPVAGQTGGRGVLRVVYSTPGSRMFGGSARSRATRRLRWVRRSPPVSRRSSPLPSLHSDSLT